MKTTILVSVSEKHEQPVEVLTVELVNVNAALSAGMPTDQAYELLEHLQPLLEKMRLKDYERIELAYFLDGIPGFQETWYRTPSGYPGETAMPIGPGQKLYRMPIDEVSLAHITL
jgi:hypothetical protein